jgi:hypothetical protein
VNLIGSTELYRPFTVGRPPIGAVTTHSRFFTSNVVGCKCSSTEGNETVELVRSAVATVAPPELYGSVAGRRVWRISCGDVINRERVLTVLVERNQVVLVGPPGETAVLTTGQLGQLRAALREAAEQAER